MTMFQYLEYPASRGKIHIASANPYKEPFFDSGFMNNKADFAPIRWSYKKTREVARRMDGMLCIVFQIIWEYIDSKCIGDLQPSGGSLLLIILTFTRRRLQPRRTLTSRLPNSSCLKHSL